jgi:Polysaccharide biosynthesis/export protein/SLBB domain
MSVRCVVCIAALLLSLAGCAKNPQTVASTQGLALPPPVADDSRLHPPGDGGPLPSDPVASMPPMPVAALDAIKALNQPGHGGAVAFLNPMVTHIERDPEVIAAVPAAFSAYTLDSGDKVRVFVYGQPNLSHIYPVDAAGAIAVPLIGSVRARGTTTVGLGQSIAARLGSSVVKDPQVSVELALARPFYILGEVRASGPYAFEPGLTLEAAVAVAGGFSSRANQRQARLTRRVDGVPTEIRALMNEPIRPGDTITIEERWF